jgi:carbon starvation protein
MPCPYLNVVNNYWPQKLYLLCAMSIILMVLISIVFVAAFRRWSVLDPYGDKVLALAETSR